LAANIIYFLLAFKKNHRVFLKKINPIGSQQNTRKDILKEVLEWVNTYCNKPLISIVLIGKIMLLSYAIIRKLYQSI